MSSGMKNLLPRCLAQVLLIFALDLRHGCPADSLAPHHNGLSMGMFGLPENMAALFQEAW